MRAHTGSALPGREAKGIGGAPRGGRGHSNPFRECPEPHPWLSDEAENPPAVVGLARKVPPLNLRKGRGATRRGKRALALAISHGPERRRPDMYKLLVVGRNRIGDVGELQPVDAAEGGQNDPTHNRKYPMYADQCPNGTITTFRHQGPRHLLR